MHEDAHLDDWGDVDPGGADDYDDYDEDPEDPEEEDDGHDDTWLLGGEEEDEEL
jgi:hypothetical protein